MEKIYTGPYKVVKRFFKSDRKEVLGRGLTREEAMRMVDSFPDSPRNMVTLDKQYSSNKYYK